VCHADDLGMKRAKDDVGVFRMVLYVIFAALVITQGLWAR